MFIFHVYAKSGQDHDCYEEHVVRAYTEQEALEIVPCADECDKRLFFNGRLREPHHTQREHDCVWRSPEFASVELLGVAVGESPSGVIVSNFRAD